MNIARSRQTTTTVIIWTATNIRRTLLVKFVKHNQNYYLKLDVSTSIRGLHQKKLVLSSSGSWHDGKTPCQVKAVVWAAQSVAALIMVHGLLCFLSDVYGLFDPSGKTLWLSVDHRRLSVLPLPDGSKKPKYCRHSLNISISPSTTAARGIIRVVEVGFKKPRFFRFKKP